MPSRLPLVRLEHASVSLGGVRVLHDLTWAMRRGEHWAVLGPNGSGKSTFLRLVRGEIWPEQKPLAPVARRPDRLPAQVGPPRVYAFDGRVQASPVGLRERIAIVSPELQARYLQQDWSLTVGQVVASGFALTDYVHHNPDAGQRGRVDVLLDRLGIAALRRRNVQQLSQGELRRTLIARALANRPRILILDEFCDGLDAAARRGLIERLSDFTRDGMQLLYTTHRPGELPACITHLLALEDGRIAWQGPKSKPGRTRVDSGLAPEAPLAPSLSPHRMRGGGARRPDEGCSVKGAAGLDCTFLFRLRGVSVFLDRKPVLRGVHWRMNADENWAVLGRNGAGKSTFLKLLAGEVHPALGGEVWRFGADARHTLWQVRRRIGQVSADFQAAYRDDITGEQAIASGFFGSIGLLRRRPTAEHLRVVRGLVKRFGLGAFAKQSVQRMSYGELRRILLARALVHDPAVLLLDEPFDGLDLESKLALQAALDDLSRNGTRLLVVTHHLDDLPRCITHAAVLEAGRVVASGAVGGIAIRESIGRWFDRHIRPTS